MYRVTATLLQYISALVLEKAVVLRVNVTTATKVSTPITSNFFGIV